MSYSSTTKQQQRVRSPVMSTSRSGAGSGSMSFGIDYAANPRSGIGGRSFNNNSSNRAGGGGAGAHVSSSSSTSKKRTPSANSSTSRTSAAHSTGSGGGGHVGGYNQRPQWNSSNNSAAAAPPGMMNMMSPQQRKALQQPIQQQQFRSPPSNTGGGGGHGGLLGSMLHRQQQQQQGSASRLTPTNHRQHHHHQQQLTPTNGNYLQQQHQMGSNGGGGHHDGHQEQTQLQDVFTSKLQSLMAVREQIEALAEQHKSEELELAKVLDKVMTVEEDRRQQLFSDETTRHELYEAIQGRDKALQMFDLFRKEGEAVISRLHESVKKSHNKHEHDLKAIEMLNAENERLKHLLHQKANTEDGGGGGGGGSSRSRAEELASSTAVEQLDELLQQADAVIINLKANNEELLRQNKDLRMRAAERMHRRSSREQDSNEDSQHDADDYTPGNSSFTGSREDLASADLGAGSPGSAGKLISDLRAELRKEKRQRLEAEELYHEYVIQHQRNVSLLEQRLHRNTPRGQTPRGRLSQSIAAAAAPGTTPPQTPGGSFAGGGPGNGGSAGGSTSPSAASPPSYANHLHTLQQQQEQQRHADPSSASNAPLFSLHNPHDDEDEDAAPAAAVVASPARTEEVRLSASPGPRQPPTAAPTAASQSSPTQPAGVHSAADNDRPAGSGNVSEDSLTHRPEHQEETDGEQLQHDTLAVVDDAEHDDRLSGAGSDDDDDEAVAAAEEEAANLAELSRIEEELQRVADALKDDDDGT